jgi:hypothetical protein
MPADDPKQLTLTSITEWSKWVTAIGFLSVTGCVGVLLTKGVGEKNIINIKLAIIFFLITIVLSWVIQIVVAELKQHLAGAEPGSGVIKIFSVTVLRPLLRLLIFIEIIIFFLSIFYLAKWIWNISPATPQQNKTEAVQLPSETA